MELQNGTGQEQEVVRERLNAFKEGLGTLVDHILGEPPGAPSRFRAFSNQATETIKAHPIAATALALGLGYLVVRTVRR